MKKIFFVLGCVLSLVVSGSVAFADEMTTTTSSSSGTTDGRLRLGVEGGINLANLNGQNVNDVIGSRLGFVGGGFIGVPLTSNFAIQPEVLYEQKGGKFNGNTYQLNYVEIPVLADIILGSPELNLGILVGPSLDFNVANNGGGINSTDLGLMGGLQLDIDRIFVTGRYEVGMTNISSNQNLQNGTFTLMVGLSFI